MIATEPVSTPATTLSTMRKTFDAIDSAAAPVLRDEGEVVVAVIARAMQGALARRVRDG
jgi:hypothetical protein